MPTKLTAMMSIRMLKICGDSDSVYKPLGLIFRACLEHGVFPQNRKKVNFVSTHKRRQAINKEL